MDDQYMIRNSTDPSGPIIRMPLVAWRQFVAEVKNDGFGRSGSN